MIKNLYSPKLTTFLEVFKCKIIARLHYPKKISELEQSPDDGIVAWLTEITHSIGLLISPPVGLNLKAQLGEYGT